MDTGQTFGFSLALPNAGHYNPTQLTAALEVQAMRQTEFRSEKPNVRRKYLSPDEARRVIEAAGKVGRQGERDKLLLTLIYRHGLRVSEAVDLRWSDFNLEAAKDRALHVRRLKGSKDSIHTLEPDTARLLKRLEREVDGQYVFRSERGGPMSVDARPGHLQARWRGCRPEVSRSPPHAAPCLRLLPRRRGHVYAADPGLSRAQGHQEYRHIHGDQPTQVGNRAGAVGSQMRTLTSARRLREAEAAKQPAVAESRLACWVDRHRHFWRADDGW